MRYETEPRSIESTFETAELETIMLAAEAQDATRQELRYSHDNDLSIDRLSEGKARCTGYTIRMSEELDKRGVSHTIGFVNGHATTLVPTISDIWFFDSLLPHFNQPTCDIISRLKTLPNGRKVSFLNSQLMVLRGEKGWYEAHRDHSWVSIHGSSDERVNEFDTRNHRLIISIFEPEEGREILYDLERFKEHDRLDRPRAAAKTLIKLDKNFPDIDLRSSYPRMVIDVVKRVAEGGDQEIALRATDAFFSSFEGIKDSRVEEYRADCLRHIAFAAGHKQIARTALNLYARARSRPHSFKASLSDKIALCERLAN